MGKLLGPLVAYLVQVPVLIGCELGLLPLHPIVLILPLVVFLNIRLDGRGAEGLGMDVLPSARSLFLIVVLGLLRFSGRLIALWLRGIELRDLSLTGATVLSLGRSFAVDVFIIALWEEIVNRGYIQTRLQEAWGFRGVLVTAFLFGSLHVPSAVDTYGCTWLVLYQALQSSLGGLILGVVYWWTGSVPATIVLHGLDNIGFSVGQVVSGLSGAAVQTVSPAFQILWLGVQFAVMLLAGRLLFGPKILSGQTEALR